MVWLARFFTLQAYSSTGTAEVLYTLSSSPSNAARIPIALQMPAKHWLLSIRVPNRRGTQHLDGLSPWPRLCFVRYVRLLNNQTGTRAALIRLKIGKR